MQLEELLAYGAEQRLVSVVVSAVGGSTSTPLTSDELRTAFNAALMWDAATTQPAGRRTRHDIELREAIGSRR